MLFKEISTFITILYFYLMPSTGEGLYWYTGAVTYQIPGVLSLLFLSAFIRLEEGKLFFNKLIHIILIVFLLGIIMGFNEVMTLMILAFFPAYYWVKNDKTYHFKSLLIIFVFALLAGGVMIFSPGNSERMSEYNIEKGIFHLLGMSLLQTARFFTEFISNVPLLASTILFIPWVKYARRFSSVLDSLIKVDPFKLSALLLFVIFLSVFPAYWGTGILGQHRTVNVAYFFFIPLWYMTIACWVFYYDKKVKRSLQIKWPRKWKMTLISLIILSFFTTKNGFIVMTDLVRGDAAKYAEEMKKRHKTLQNASDNNKSNIKIPPIVHRPGAFMILPLRKDNEHWINKSYSAYYKVDNISVRRLQKKDLE
ncbi:MAG: DUF6056 family protein [Flavobacteriales bacterium]